MKKYFLYKIFTLFLFINIYNTNLFAQNERPEAIVIPVSYLGKVSIERQNILQNSLEEKLRNYFKLVPQDKFLKAQESAFEELDYDECTEDQCILLIQEMLQVENVFNLQLIGEGENTQLSLNWRTLDEKKNQINIRKKIFFIILFYLTFFKFNFSKIKI